MALAATRGTLAATAAVLVVAPTNGPIRVIVRNQEASAVCYLGGEAVTTSTGFKLAAGESLGFTLDPSEACSFIGAGAGTSNAIHVFVCKL